MDGYAIEIWNQGRGTTRYREAGTDTWDLDDAAAKAYSLLFTRAQYVGVGNGEQEFRTWGDDAIDAAARWAEWYVDVELDGHRWRYRPLADLHDYNAASELADEASELHPSVTRVWFGATNGDEEYENETRAK